MRVVCPECDRVMAVKPEQVGLKVPCEQCGHSLKILRRPDKGAPPPLPKSQEEINKPQHPEIGERPDHVRLVETQTEHTPGADNASRLESGSPDLTTVVLESTGASVVRLKLHQHRKRQRALATTGVLFVACVAALVVSYAVISRQHLSNSTLLSDDKSELDSELGISESAVDALAASTEPAPIDAAATPIVRQPLVYFTPAEIDLVWQRVRPHLVQLKVTTAAGERYCGGVIVSPHGWVVTSLRALSGAQRIVVQQAPGDMYMDSGDEELSDEVRGVVGVFPELDLVFLLINRRLVNALVGPSLSPRPLTSSLFLIQTAPPGLDRWPWVTEARINVSPLDRGVPAEKLVNVREKGFQIDTHFLGHNKISRSSPGSGLFDADGRLVGVNTSIELESDLLIVDAKAIETLMRGISGDVSDLRALPGFGVSLLAGDGNAAPEKPSPSDNEELNPHPANPLLDNLKHWAAVIGERGWRASNTKEYGEWQELAQVYSSLFALRDDVNQPPELRRNWIRETDRVAALWRSELNKLSPETVAEINRLGWAAIQSGKATDEQAPPIILFARVHLPVLQSPQIAGKSTVTMRLSEMDAYFIAPHDPSGTLMVRDGEWLVFARGTGQRARSILDDRGVTISVESLSILLLPAKIR